MSDGLITRQELSQDLNEELNKTGILTEIEPSLQATLSDQGKDLNLVNVANAIYNETTKPDWTPALTQMKSIFSVGTGTNPDGVEVDYSNSVTKGQISDVTIKGRTVVNLLGTKGECDNVSVFNYNSNVTGVVENGRIKITCTNDTWRFQIGWINGIEVNKCYFARIDIENINVPEIRFIMSNNINQAFSINIQQNGNFSLFLKVKFTSSNPAHYSLGLTYGATITSGYLNKQCYIDNLALFEITENEYNALSEAELAQKYPYISGTKSTLSQRVVSRGKNLIINGNGEYSIKGASDALSDPYWPFISGFSGQYNDDAYWDNDEKVFRLKAWSSTRARFQLVRVKKNTDYTISFVAKVMDSGSVGVGIYDSNKNTLKSIGEVMSTSYTKKVGTFNSGNNDFVYISMYAYIDAIPNTYHYIKEIQLEEGTQATEYEPYVHSESIITWGESGEGRSLPNGVKDEIRDGTLTKMVSDEFSLNGSYITGLNTSAFSNVDAVIFTPNLTNQKPWTAEGTGQVNVYGKNEIPQSQADSLTSIGKFYTDASQRVIFLVAKGTYVDLASAQTAWNNNPDTLIYQLDKPKTYPLNITPLQAYENGSIIIEPYLAKKYTITGTSITLDYPIISIDSIKKIVNNAEQEITTATLSADGLTISNINAGTYIVEGAIKPEYSTIPTTVMSYPKNTSAQTDGNTEMINIHSKLLKELILASL